MHWRRRAEEDLIEACVHIGSDSTVAAERLLDAVEATIALLLENPYVGRLRRFRSVRVRDIRSWAVKGFPAYLIFYRSRGTDLEVVRLLRGARDLPDLISEGRIRGDLSGSDLGTKRQQPTTVSSEYPLHRHRPRSGPPIPSQDTSSTVDHPDGPTGLRPSR